MAHMDGIHALGPCFRSVAKEHLCIECDLTQAVDRKTNTFFQNAIILEEDSIFCISYFLLYIRRL